MDDYRVTAAELDGTPEDRAERKGREDLKNEDRCIM